MRLKRECVRQQRAKRRIGGPNTREVVSQRIATWNWEELNGQRQRKSYFMFERRGSFRRAAASTKVTAQPVV